MCEAHVYVLDENGEEKLLLESVDKIIPKGDELHLENIYSERKTIKAEIKTMALVQHKIVLEKK